LTPGRSASFSLGTSRTRFFDLNVAQGFGLSPELAVGFVVLVAVTPEFVTLVMANLAGGDMVLSTTAPVVIGARTYQPERVGS
jgi:BASS family bile acid:Na+ symporter